MCPISCTIELENANEYYQPGEIIKGLVNFEITGTSTILLKALSLEFNGFAYTKWEMREKVKKTRKAKPKTFIEYREDYVSTKNYLIGSDMANPKPFEPGQYKYNFIINIPLNIPSTFDSPLGFIRCELTVNADSSDHTTCLYNTALPINQIKDLRLMDTTAHLPTELAEVEHISRLKFWLQRLQLYICVPQKAFIPGECISLHVNLRNPSNLKMTSITSNLKCIMTYKGLKKEKINRETTQIKTIASTISDLNGRSSNKIDILQQIVIPKTPPTMAFDECHCIGVSYELEVLANCQNKKRCVRATMPILMGSISLRSEVKILPTRLNNNQVASIIVGKSMEELTVPSVMDLQDENNLLTNTSISMISLASSFKEADFMTTVHLNKKSSHWVKGDLNDYKPKYLYYDLPEKFLCHTAKNVASTNQMT